ncbi:MAG: MoxR family ATPase [Balneolaceae bacterium]|nr:MoxR family ATPase [Balneolaceae bacterium]
MSQTTSPQDVQVQSVLESAQIKELQDLVREVPVPESVLTYAVRMVTMSRPGSEIAPDFVNKYMSWGAGPRASQFLILGGKARALMHGRFNVTEEDIQALAKPVLRHRIINNYAAEAEKLTTDKLIDKLIETA